MSEPVVAIVPPSDDEFDWNVDVFTATSVPAIAPPWPKLRPFVNEESRTRTHTPPRKPPLPNPASPSSNVDDRTSILLALTTPPSAPPVPLFTKCEPVIETSPERVDRAGAARCEVPFESRTVDRYIVAGVDGARREARRIVGERRVPHHDISCAHRAVTSEVTDQRVVREGGVERPDVLALDRAAAESLRVQHLGLDEDDVGVRREDRRPGNLVFIGRDVAQGGVDEPHRARAVLHEQVDGTRTADRVTVTVDDGELARRPLDAGAQGDVGAEVDERDARVRPCRGQLRRFVTGPASPAARPRAVEPRGRRRRGRGGACVQCVNVCDPTWPVRSLASRDRRCYPGQRTPSVNNVSRHDVENAAIHVRRRGTAFGVARIVSDAERFPHGYACAEPCRDHGRPAPRRSDGMRGCAGRADAEPRPARVRRGALSRVNCQGPLCMPAPRRS